MILVHHACPTQIAHVKGVGVVVFVGNGKVHGFLGVPSNGVRFQVQNHFVGRGGRSSVVNDDGSVGGGGREQIALGGVEGAGGDGVAAPFKGVHRFTAVVVPQIHHGGTRDELRCSLPIVVDARTTPALAHPRLFRRLVPPGDRQRATLLARPTPARRLQVVAPGPSFGVKTKLFDGAVVPAGKQPLARAVDGQASNETRMSVGGPDGALQRQVPDTNFPVAGTGHELRDAGGGRGRAPDTVRMVVHGGDKGFGKHFVQFDRPHRSCVFTGLFEGVKAGVFVALQPFHAGDTFTGVIGFGPGNGFDLHGGLVWVVVVVWWEKGMCGESKLELGGVVRWF